MSKELERHAAVCELIGEVARAGDAVRLRVTGGSMLPALWPGDVLTVSSCAATELQLGDILLFRREGRLTAHRLVAIDQVRIITKGDAQAAADPPVTQTELVGRVTRIERNGRVVSTIQSRWQQLAGRLLSRSDFLLRITLGAHRRLKN